MHRIILLVMLLATLSACGGSRKPADTSKTNQEDAVAAAVAATVAAKEASSAGSSQASNDASNGDATAVPQPGKQNDAGSGKDAGNEIESAIEIKANTDSPYSATLAEGDSSDYYKVNIPAGTVLTVDFQNTGKSYTQPAFYHDGVKLDYANINASDKWKPVWVLNTGEGGDYVLGVVDGVGDYKFRILYKPQQDASVEGDAGDETSAARKITANADKPYQGELGNNDKDDYYSVTLPAGSVVTIEFQNTGKSYAQPAFYHDGVKLDYANINASDKWTPVWVLNTSEAGDYVFGVNGGSTYSFNILVQPQQDAGVEGDAGDETSAAREVQINVSQPYAGRLGNNDKDDFYRFTLSAPSKLKIVTRVDEKSRGGVGIALFKGDVRLGDVRNIAFGSPGTLSGDQALEAGDYILQISGDAMYDFAISSVP